MRGSGLEKMHQCIINCNNELEDFVRHNFFSRHCCSLLGIPTLQMGPCSTVLRRSLLIMLLIYFRKKICISISDLIGDELIWLMAWLVHLSSCKFCIWGLLGVFSPTSSWDGILFTCHWLNVCLKNFMYFSFFLKFWIKSEWETRLAFLSLVIQCVSLLSIAAHVYMFAIAKWPLVHTLGHTISCLHQEHKTIMCVR